MSIKGLLIVLSMFCAYSFGVGTGQIVYDKQTYNNIPPATQENYTPTINGIDNDVTLGLNYKYTIIGVAPSGSMLPAVTAGNYMIVELDCPVSVGDIVWYNLDNGAGILHRIIEINGTEVITKGDANKYADSPIQLLDIIGRVKVVIY